MTYEAHWYIKGKVYYVKYHDVITVEEGQQVIKNALPLLAEAHPPVHVIVDYTENPAISLPFRKVLETKEIQTQFQHADIGWTVRIVEKDWDFYNLFTSMLMLRLDATTHICQTLDEAMAFLLKHDESITLYR